MVIFGGLSYHSSAWWRQVERGQAGFAGVSPYLLAIAHST
jgi:hypothetical protein